MIGASVRLRIPAASAARPPKKVSCLRMSTSSILRNEMPTKSGRQELSTSSNRSAARQRVEPNGSMTRLAQGRVQAGQPQGKDRIGHRAAIRADEENLAGHEVSQAAGSALSRAAQGIRPVPSRPSRAARRAVVGGFAMSAFSLKAARQGGNRKTPICLDLGRHRDPPPGAGTACPPYHCFPFPISMGTGRPHPGHVCCPGAYRRHGCGPLVVGEISLPWKPPIRYESSDALRTLAPDCSGTGQRNGLARSFLGPALELCRAGPSG